MKVRFRSPRARRPEHDRGLKVPYGAARRSGYRLRWYLIVVLVSIPVVYLGYSFAQLLLISELPGRVLLKRLEVSAPVDAEVIAVPVAPGDRVDAGAPVLGLRDPARSEERGELRAVLDSVTQALARQRGERQRLAARWATSLQQPRQRLQELQALRAAGAATRGEVRRAEQELAETRVARDVDLAAAERRIGELERRRAELQARLDAVTGTGIERTLTAPVDAVVDTVTADAGLFVSGGETLMTLLVPGRATLVLYVSPRDASRLDPGTRLTLTFPDRTGYAAEVADLGAASEPLPAPLAGAFSSPEGMRRLRLSLREPLRPRHAVHGLAFKASPPGRLPWLRF